MELEEDREDDLASFDVVDFLPEKLLQVELCELSTVFPKPTLVRLGFDLSSSVASKPPMFVSIALHGNEDAGLLAIQEFFRHNSLEELPRPMILFAGNIEATRLGVRHTRQQQDYNRSWPGTDLADCPEQRMLERVTRDVLQTPLHASVDIHNNTGRNPHYGCICSLDPQHLHIASLFSQRVVYFTRPSGVQTQAFMEHCPSVTLECGRIGDLNGPRSAAVFLSKCMQTEEFGQAAVAKPQVFRAVARITLREGCTVGFEKGVDVLLREDIDLLNFSTLPAGEKLAKLESKLESCFVVRNSEGQDVTSTFLRKTEEGDVCFETSVMPSMLTKDLKVMQQDCLGYIMETM